MQGRIIPRTRGTRPCTCPRAVINTAVKPCARAAPDINSNVTALLMIYIVAMLVFLGEYAIRALLGIPDFVSAFGHGVLAGLVVIGIDVILDFIRSFSPRS